MIRGIENFREWFYGYEDRYVIIGGTALGALHLIPFKAKAWMDLSDKKARGDQIDSKNIRKHKNDIFRLTELLESNVQPFTLSERIKADMREFLDRMVSEEVDLKQIGISDKTKDIILGELREIYQ